MFLFATKIEFIFKPLKTFRRYAIRRQKLQRKFIASRVSNRIHTTGTSFPDCLEDGISIERRFKDLNFIYHCIR